MIPEIRSRSVPLLPALVVLICGIIIGAGLKDKGAQVFLFLFIGLGMLFVIMLIRGYNKKFLGIIFLFTLLSFSAFNYIKQNIPDHNDIYQVLPFEGKVKARVLLPARSLVVRAVGFVRDGKETKCSGRILLRFQGEPPAPGSLVEITGKFYKPQEPMNPGQFNYKRYLGHRGIFTQADVDFIELIAVAGPGSLIGGIRKYVSAVISDYLPQREAGVLTGILLGNPSFVSREIVERFRISGIMHVLAVSGLHVGIILFAVYYLLNVFGAGRRNAFIIALVLMYLYVLVAGARPSSVRAALMLTMLVAGDLIGGRGNVYNSLCFAAITILLITPGLIFTSGFVLSFTAVAGIIYLGPVFARYMGKPLSVSFSAVLAITPVLAWNFYYVPLAAPLTNLIVVPAIGITVSLGIFMVIIAGFIPVLADIYAFSITYMIRFISWIAHIVSASGLGGITVCRPSIISVVLFYFLLIIIGWRSSRIKTFAVIIMSIAVIGSVFMGPGRRPFIAVLKKGNSYVSVLNEGRNGAVLLTGKEDIDENMVSSFLYSRGIEKIRDIFFLYPVYGSMAGIARLANKFDTKNIYFSGTYADKLMWYEFKRKLSDASVSAVKSGDIIKNSSYLIEVMDPQKKYIDIRDNFIQLMLKGDVEIFIYCGGSVLCEEADVVLAVQPYRPDWENIRARCRGLVVYCGKEGSPEDIYRINKRGRVFYL
ncbi:ComEC/Rec2 family competence protein [Elusimicrobiota bacterium]